MEPNELERYALAQALDSVRRHNPPLDRYTIGEIADHIRDAWLAGFEAGKNLVIPSKQTH